MTEEVYRSPVADHDCNGCGAKPGQRHIPTVAFSQEAGHDTLLWCDLARCVQTGRQLWTCEGQIHVHGDRQYGEHEGECAPDVWDGEYPGTKLARALGLYTDPASIFGLTEDLNELMRNALWDRTHETYLYGGHQAKTTIHDRDPLTMPLDDLDDLTRKDIEEFRERRAKG